MAEEHHQKSSHEFEPTVTSEGSVEAKDRGLFDFLGKKEEEKPQDQEVIASEFDQKVQVSEQHEPPKVEEPKIEEPKVEEEKKPGLLEKLHRSGSSSSSSSSDEEEGEGSEEKKKKKKEKKGLKEKLKEKVSGEKADEKHEEETAVPVEVVHQEPPQSEEKKGFLDKIKGKLPGQHKKPEEVPAHPTSPPPPPPPAEHHEAAPPSHEGEPKEKKGIFEKIKEKLPGYHSKTEEEKEKEKESASH